MYRPEIAAILNQGHPYWYMICHACMVPTIKIICLSPNYCIFSNRGLYALLWPNLVKVGNSDLKPRLELGILVVPETIIISSFYSEQAFIMNIYFIFRSGAR